MRTFQSRSYRRITTLALGCFLLAGVASAAPPQALGSAADDLLAPSLQRPEAVATSVFVGPVSTETVQVATGYDVGIYTDTRGDSIAVTPDAIVLERTGIYQVHMEGVLFFASGDPTGDPEAAGLFALLVNDDGQVFCEGSNRASAPALPAVLAPTPDHDRVSRCETTFTIKVHGDGSSPLAFPRGTQLQVALAPDDRPLGDATLELVRVEVTRLGH